MPQLLKIKAQMSGILAKGCVLLVCVLYDLTWLPLHGGGRKSWYIFIFMSNTAETWSMRSTEKRKVNVFEMKSLRIFVGESHEWIKIGMRRYLLNRAGIEREFANRADPRVMRWFGHVERMDEYRMARWVLKADVSGERVRGRPGLG